MRLPHFRRKDARTPLPSRPGRHIRRTALALGCAGVCGCALVGLSGANGGTGAAAADLLRSTIGPARTAQVESLYLNAADAWQQLQYRVGATRPRAPWIVPPTPITPRMAYAIPETPTRRIASRVTASRAAVHTVRKFPPLPVLRPVVFPTLPGEGTWTSSVAPASSLDPYPLIAKAFLRPDPARPYAIATVLRFDLRFLRLHVVAGTAEPGGAVGMPGSGSVSPSDRAPGILLAAFNGGFKFADGAYGLMVNRRIYVRPVDGAATIAITTRGTVFMGTWGKNPHLTVHNPRLMSWRQNGSLLISRGAINPLAANDGAWGTTVLNNVHTWRSAIGIAPHRVLLYVAGNALSVSGLAQIMKAAGARTAMELDINPYWVRAFFYGRDPARHLTMAKLRPDMAGIGSDFMRGYSRDFFYLTRIPGLSKP